jgi:signal transduction histidine kinase
VGASGLFVMNTITKPEKSLTVLVVDDIQASRSHLASLVTDIGYHCLQVSSGMAALQCIDTQQADLVLLDLLMPDIDGFEITRQIRKRVTGKWLPVIVVSSLEGDEHFIHAMSVGAADYLVKPVKPAILRAKLHHYQRVLGLQAKTAMLVQRQKAINEYIADPIITIDSNARVFELNLAARRLFEINAPQSLVGKRINDLIGIGLEQLPSTSEIVVNGPGNMPVNLAVSTSEWSVGTQSYCTIALHDLSESRRVERMKDEFLATVSHELRTPLTSILGALGLLVAGASGVLPSEALELATVAQRNGTRLSRLIDDLLDLTKLEGNRMTFNLRETPLNALLEEAVSANMAYAQSHGVHLRFITRVQTAQSTVDAHRLLQVLANLISNAIKHSPAGSTAEVRLVEDPKGWLIEVADRGPGIDPEFRQRMFEKFSQADGSDQRSISGTGLGLYISKMLVDRMGGVLSAQSGAGKGSVLSILLPRSGRNVVDPWVLCIAHDCEILDRLGDWASDVARTELVRDLASAEALVQRVGAPFALLADPMAQGPADVFCKQLSSLTAHDRVLLVSDDLDEHFAQAHGLRCFALSKTSRKELGVHLQTLLNLPASGAKDG